MSRGPVAQCGVLEHRRVAALDRLRAPRISNRCFEDVQVRGTCDCNALAKANVPTGAVESGKGGEEAMREGFGYRIRARLSPVQLKCVRALF